MNQFFGKYRGKVTNNVDPKQLGCIQVSVPAVLGVGTQSWATPCVPIAGPQAGFYAIPIVGSDVWIEFEGGNPDFPIWTGCFWSAPAALPPSMGLATPPPVPHITLQTPLQKYMLISDAPGPAGGIQLAVGLSTILINEIGIILSTPGATIKMTALGVDINNTALTVLPS
jgi:hypothetical protein